MIPPKIIIKGDPALGSMFIGEAYSQLNILRDSMKFQGLKQSFRTVEVAPGVLVQCNRNYNLETVTIYTQGGGQEQEQRERIKEVECFCNCNFARGIVLSVEAVEDEIFDKLTVAACYDRTLYRIYENVLASDFTPWEEGGKCIVMAYNGFLYDCCNLNYDATGCRPIKDEANEFLSDDWRTTIRVVPLCAIPVLRWNTKYGDV
jgi:hypothetical protein